MDRWVNGVAGQTVPLNFSCTFPGVNHRYWLWLEEGNLMTEVIYVYPGRSDKSAVATSIPGVFKW